MQTLPCSTCNKQVNLSNVKYFTADKKHVFCDAYCSFEWYNGKINKPNKTIEKINKDERIGEDITIGFGVSIETDRKIIEKLAEKEKWQDLVDDILDDI